MPENSEIVLNTAEEDSAGQSRQLVVPALGSALVPGLGQLILREKRRAGIYFALLIIWFLFFLPPFRIPRFYPGVLFALFSAVALTITATCQALRSRAWERRPGSYWWLFVMLPLACIAASAYWGIALRVGGFRDFRVPSTSMEPTIMQGDAFLADMHYYRHRRPRQESIILINSPHEPGVIVVKRVIAVAGDTIRSVNGQVYLNGQALHEPYIQHIGNAPEELMDFGPIPIPTHKLFVMGDNRDVSLDSRTAGFGMVDESAIIGRVLYILNSSRDRTGKSVH